MNTDPSATVNTLGGHWALALIMVVIGFWIVFKYLAPSGGKEWRSAGVLQAFIIALYVEMYGFPLTIYLLTNFLGFNIPWLHFNGHLWAALLGLGVAGAMVEMFIGLGIVVLGIILIARGWHLVYSAQREGNLVTGGVYQYMRHPQYTGIYMALFGQLIHWPTLPTLALFPVIIWIYYRLARKEERDMKAKFGRQYEAYCKRTPMFFPPFHQWGQVFGGRHAGADPSER